MRLLLVEDDADVAETLVLYLEKQGFVVDVATSLAMARDALDDGGFDLVVLDRGLPDGDGVSLIAWSEQRNRRQRFIVLTALSSIDHRVEGLESGAEDYIAKPFEPRELLARIRTALRRPIETRRETRRFGPLMHDLESGVFFVDETPLTLRRTEALVLEALMARPGAVIQRETLEARVYGYDKVVNANSLESQISRLRTNLARRTDKVRIQAVRGLGYCLTEDG
ncbi:MULTISPECIES: response regulator transcription factor [Brevundimonas]|jgi:DNA-binding response OmpR family regulator|uniref:response regulator transcription factor n=1 Tax=Brevundimonas TaxID=41275 RepID=UPI00128F30C5|nr:MULTISPECIES: response regulator transcription factor [Brevundimonas]MCC4293804.1 response regulator transcription factor [Brevundimonas aurantiaca]QFU31759.1 Swarming motility regulation protein RssB [Brevundimonas sp. Bb-A]